MKLLGLDIATRVGWACGDTRGPIPHVGHVDLPPGLDGARGHTFREFRRWLRDTILENGVGRLVFEQPILPHPKVIWERGKPRAIWATNIEVTLMLQGLVAVMEELCEAERIPCTYVTIQEVKKMLAGDGKAEKEDMVRAARKFYPALEVHDEADAFGVWLCGVFHYDRPALMPFEKKLWSALL